MKFSEYGDIVHLVSQSLCFKDYSRVGLNNYNEAGIYFVKSGRIR